MSDSYDSLQSALRADNPNYAKAFYAERDVERLKAELKAMRKRAIKAEKEVARLKRSIKQSMLDKVQT